MSRILTTLIAVVALMLSMAAGQRMALADQTTAVVSAALDQHERHVGGTAAQVEHAGFGRSFGKYFVEQGHVGLVRFGEISRGIGARLLFGVHQLTFRHSFHERPRGARPARASFPLAPDERGKGRRSGGSGASGSAARGRPRRVGYTCVTETRGHPEEICDGPRDAVCLFCSPTEGQPSP